MVGGGTREGKMKRNLYGVRGTGKAAVSGRKAVNLSLSGQSEGP